jgi:hypothetical protein
MLTTREKRNLELMRLSDDTTEGSVQHLRDACCRVIVTSHALEIVNV